MGHKAGGGQAGKDRSLAKSFDSGSVGPEPFSAWSSSSPSFSSSSSSSVLLLVPVIRSQFLQFLQFHTDFGSRATMNDDDETPRPEVK